MNGLILVLSLICGAASIGAAVCAVLILRLLREYGVKACYYGHLHGASHRRAIEGTRS